MHFTGTVYRNPYWPNINYFWKSLRDTHNFWKVTPPPPPPPRRVKSAFSEREMLEELKLFVENLTCDCSFITHHTISGDNLSGTLF